MQDYSRRQGRVHVALVCVLTLLPALTILTLLDIVPLASVKEDSNRNYIFWIRLVLAVALMVAGVVQHFCWCLPGLAVRRTDLIAIGIFGSGTGALFCWALSQAIGFPVPFTMVIQSALTIPTIVLSLRMIWRRALRSNLALQKELRARLFVFAGQCCMTYTYALFFFAFTSLNSFGQSVFTFALPLIKFGLKNYMSRALRQSYDVKPAFIVFNVDLFSSLYVVSCLQASQSSINTVLIMFVDILQIAISIWDIHFVLREIDSLLPPGLHRQSLFDLHAKVSAKSGAKPAAVPRADGPSRDLIPTQTLESVAPVSSALTRALDPNRKSNKRLARAIARVLFIAEFVLLIEFTEVMVPIIYGLYLGAMSNLPNRAHYPNLANLDDHQLRKSISRVVINAFFELSSFIGTTWIIRRQLKLSTTHIVAFVLESQASLVQASLVLWILYIIQQSLVHSGEFSDLRVQAMQEYSCRHNQLRTLLICVLTPLPALMTVILSDIVPLAPPEQGSNRNYVYWLRFVFAVALMIASIVQHFCCCIPGLSLRRMELLAIGFIGSGTGALFLWALSQFIGFPVPFTMVMQSAAIVPTIVLTLRIIWRRALQGNPALQTDLRHHLFVFAGQCSVVYVYALYFFAFTSLNSLGQSVFTFAFPIIKCGLKNYISRALRRLYDLKPAFVVFNIDLFSSLDVVICLQASQSFVNTVLIMIVDVLQIAISIWDIHLVLRQIDSLLPSGRTRNSLFELYSSATTPSDATIPTRRMQTAGPSRELVPPRSLNAIAPSPVLTVPNPQHDQHRLARAIAKVLYIAEFVLLIEFTEVMVPIIYGLYLGAMSHLPNRAYYPQLASLNDRELRESISRVLLNACFEFASFLATNWIIRRQLKISTTHLVAFVLETQASMIQGSLMLSILFIILQSLTHSANPQLFDHSTVLHYAALHKKWDIVLLLLQHGADPRKDNGDITPLHYAAAELESVDVVEGLLRAGADVNAVDKSGNYAVHVDAKSDNLSSLKKLLELGADPCTVNTLGQSVLHLATKAQKFDHRRGFVNERCRCKREDQSLHWAAAYGPGEVVESLLAHGVDPNATDNVGKIAVHCAAAYGHADAVKALLSGGADIAAVSNEGYTTLHRAAQGGQDAAINVLLALGAENGKTALHIASEKGQDEEVEALLAGGANANAADNRGCTALHVAAQEDEEDFVGMLLTHDADVKARQLHYAVAKFHQSISEHLLTASADPNAVTNDGCTPLHIASVNQCNHTVTELLDLGCNAPARNEAGQTPLAMCLQWKRDERMFNWVLNTTFALMSRGALYEDSPDNFPPVEEVYREGAEIIPICVKHWSEEQRRGKWPLTEVPHEISDRGPTAVRTYLREVSASSENDLVLRRKVCIVGSSKTGKTSLVKSITSMNSTLVDEENRTIGVDLFHLEFTEKTNESTSGKKNHDITFWDFAGQDEYHVAHSLFFSRRTLYLLCVETAAFSQTLESSRMCEDEDEAEALIDSFVRERVWRWFRISFTRQPDAEFVLIATKADAMGGNGEMRRAVGWHGDVDAWS
ncbi:hypothetical protein Poli38472_004363 [Pythium oligandrum]|uniref:Non-specific serine/threonine protein kinase n=1 Tax=Pythium oligandrum TaxID=41045 RepID=A0A8K1FFS8_PYTOL|nr:hypothetical protein Poli38472_004363 [Pythium oligandrum]|eukprot:TMW59294.1 hypothetical protein Poli38472_004363 [Pythium oligandrum]